MKSVLLFNGICFLLKQDRVGSASSVKLLWMDEKGSLTGELKRSDFWQLSDYFWWLVVCFSHTFQYRLIQRPQPPPRHYTQRAKNRVVLEISKRVALCWHCLGSRFVIVPTLSQDKNVNIARFYKNLIMFNEMEHGIKRQTFLAVRLFADQTAWSSKTVKGGWGSSLYMFCHFQSTSQHGGSSVSVCYLLLLSAIKSKNILDIR